MISCHLELAMECATAVTGLTSLDQAKYAATSAMTLSRRKRRRLAGEACRVFLFSFFLFFLFYFPFPTLHSIAFFSFLNVLPFSNVTVSVNASASKSLMSVEKKKNR